MRHSMPWPARPCKLAKTEPFGAMPNDGMMAPALLPGCPVPNPLSSAQTLAQQADAPRLAQGEGVQLTTQN